MRRRWNAISLAALSLAIISSPATVVGQAPAPGTYRVWLCAEVCTPQDSSRAIAVATIVIVGEQAATEESARLAFAGLPAIGHMRDARPTDNACFSVSSRETRAGSEELFFGIQPRGRTRWERDANDGFSMRVYQSPDAGYVLRWTESSSVTRGEGWSYGWAANTPYHRNAYFAARRLGEPDIARCIY
jgi:hypothetical protein